MLKLHSNSIFLSLRPFKLLMLGFSLFFYLYGVNFTFLPVSTARIILLVAWGYLLLRLFFNPSISVNRSNILIFSIFLVFGYWIVLMSLIGGLTDSSMLTSVSLMVLHSLAGGWVLSILFKKMNFDFRRVVLFIQLVITIQAVFILIYFVSWDFREFTFQYIPQTGNIDYQQNLFQSRGLTHSSGAVLSVLQSLGVLFTAYLLSTVSYRSGQFYYLLFSFGLLCLSIVITGRTGLLILPLVVLYFIIMLLLHRGMPKNIGYFVFAAPVILLVSFFIFRFLYYNIWGGITTAAGEDILDRVIRWYLVEFFDEGRLQSRTFDILRGHWFFPDDLSIILFGDTSTWDVNRISSDVGYVRMWHGIGALGIVLYYITVLTVFIYMVILAGNYPEKTLLIILGIYLLIIEMKEPFIFNITVNAFLLMVFAFLLFRPGELRE